MRRPKSPRKNVTFTVRLPADVVEALDEDAKQNKMYRNELIEAYLRNGIEQGDEPRIPLYEWVSGDTAVLYDRLARRLVVVVLDTQEKAVICNYHKAKDCEHAEFVKDLPLFGDLTARKLLAKKDVPPPPER